MRLTLKILEIRDDNKKIYDICFDSSFEHLEDELRKIGISERKVCIITDTNVAPLYLNVIENICKNITSKVVSFVFEAGEASKNLSVIEKIYEKLILEKFDRKDYLIALGGGVTGDMTGYSAATYLRGISFIQIPTSLLAQVDSSIGGKTGVDFYQYKNMVGAFHQPSLVYINLNTLKTLNNREFSAGMSEVIKHGLIKDKNYYDWIKNHKTQIISREYEVLEEMVYKSCLIKGEVVEHDPKEQGERALLNFGHTVGHAVEKLMNFNWLHGECVAIGSIASAFISLNKGWISQSEFDDIQITFDSFSLPLKADGMDAKDILNTTKSDKKMDAGKVKFILLESIGNAVIYQELSDQEILEGIIACI